MYEDDLLTNCEERIAEFSYDHKIYEGRSLNVPRQAGQRCPLWFKQFALQYEADWERDLGNVLLSRTGIRGIRFSERFGSGPSFHEQRKLASIKAADLKYLEELCNRGDAIAKLVLACREPNRVKPMRVLVHSLAGQALLLALEDLCRVTTAAEQPMESLHQGKDFRQRW